MRLTVVLGPKGSGKTFFITLIALESKRDVYANYKIELENYKPLEVIDFIDLPNDVDVMIDEAYTWIESRISGFFLNRFLSYILWQSRKRTVDIYLTAQRFRSLDLRFREETDVLVKCKPRTNLEKDDFEFEILWVVEDKTTKLKMSYEDAKPYFDLYNTFEIVEPYALEQMKFKILESDPKKRWDNACEIGKKIKGSIKTITHPRVKAALLKNGYDTTYESLVYIYLKDLL